MTKFKFSLQGVLEIKRKLEGQAKITFGLARANLNAAEAKRDAVIRRQEEYREVLAGALEENVDMKLAKRTNEALEVLDEQLAERKMAVRRAEKQVELARAKLNAVMTERKAIEKLREKKFDEYLKEVDLEERKQTDELVSYRHSIAE